jgi:hypothetical protein
LPEKAVPDGRVLEGGVLAGGVLARERDGRTGEAPEPGGERDEGEHAEQNSTTARRRSPAVGIVAGSCGHRLPTDQWLTQCGHLTADHGAMATETGE